MGFGSFLKRAINPLTPFKAVANAGRNAARGNWKGALGNMTVGAGTMGLMPGIPRRGGKPASGVSQLRGRGGFLQDAINSPGPMQEGAETMSPPMSPSPVASPTAINLGQEMSNVRGRGGFVPPPQMAEPEAGPYSDPYENEKWRRQGGGRNPKMSMF